MNHGRRPGLSLLELLAVVTFMGILAAVAISRNGRAFLPNFSSQGDCRKISLALLEAKRLAITSGTSHAVQFTSNNGKVVSFSIVSQQAGGNVLVDGPIPLQEDLVVAVSQGEMSFNFEGQAAAAYSITLTARNRVSTISVVPITGTVSCVDTIK